MLYEALEPSLQTALLQQPAQSETGLWEAGVPFSPLPQNDSTQQPATLQYWDREGKRKAAKTFTVYSNPGKRSKPAHSVSSPRKLGRQKAKMDAFTESQTHSATQRKINLFAFCSPLSFIFKQFLKSYFMSE